MQTKNQSTEPKGSLQTTGESSLDGAACSLSVSENDPDYVNFCKAWDASGLPEYYERMDNLKSIGFRFDDAGDMDHFESEALSAWLGDERTVMSVSLSEIEAARPTILAAAKLLLENEKSAAAPSPSTASPSVLSDHGKW